MTRYYKLVAMNKWLYLLVTVLIMLGLITSACSKITDKTIEQPMISEPPQDPIESFYGVGQELMDEMMQIALADPRIQALIAEEDHTITVEGHTIESKNYNLNVGVRLKEDTTQDEFQEWLHAGRQDSELITEYVGILYIGNSVNYHLTFDMDKEVVSDIVQEKKPAVGIPSITAEEKQRAVEIALADVTLWQILEGKDYEIAPDNRIGVWHSGSTKLGVAFEISFNKIYTIDADLPHYEKSVIHISGEVEGLMINVLLEENRVAQITPIPPAPSI